MRSPGETVERLAAALFDRLPQTQLAAAQTVAGHQGARDRGHQTAARARCILHSNGGYQCSGKSFLFFIIFFDFSTVIRIIILTLESGETHCGGGILGYGARSRNSRHGDTSKSYGNGIAALKRRNCANTSSNCTAEDGKKNCKSKIFYLPPFFFFFQKLYFS